MEPSKALGSADSPRRVAIAVGKPSSQDTVALCEEVASKWLAAGDAVVLIHVELPDEGDGEAPTALPRWVPPSLAALVESRGGGSFPSVEVCTLSAASSTEPVFSVLNKALSDGRPEVHLLICGSRPTRNPLARVLALFGDDAVSPSVVQHAGVPTLVIRSTASSATTPQALVLGDPAKERRIVIAVDGSPCGRRMVAWAARWMLRSTDSVFLVHSPAGQRSDDVLLAMGEMQACRLLLRDVDIEAVPVELDTSLDVRDGILDFVAAEKAIDCILVGVGSSISQTLVGALRRFTLGSVSRHMLAHAPCSVLVLPLSCTL